MALLAYKDTKQTTITA